MRKELREKLAKILEVKKQVQKLDKILAQKCQKIQHKLHNIRKENRIIHQKREENRVKEIESIKETIFDYIEGFKNV